MKKPSFCAYLAQLRWQHHGGCVAFALLITFQVDFPCCIAMKALIGRIAPPQTLNQHRGGRYLPVKVLLSLLLLNFQRKSRPKDTLHVERDTHTHKRQEKIRESLVIMIAQVFCTLETIMEILSELLLHFVQLAFGAN